MSYTLQNTCQKENERISIMPFLLWHFSTGDKIENCPAQCDFNFEFSRECMLTSNIAKQTSNPPLDGFAVANILQA